MDKEKLLYLKRTASQLRKLIIKMISSAKSGHPGGSLSLADIVSYLFFHEMNFNTENYKDDKRDRFILSKGHAAPVLYAALSLKGFFPQEDLSGLRSVDSQLQGHPHRLDTPGVEASTGSLGQGLSMASGIALGNRISGIDSNIFAVIGDGESQEGQIWEAALTAGFRKLDKLCLFLDYNNQQIDGNVSDIKDIAPISDKWRSFKWNVIEISGHDFEEIDNAVSRFKNETERPTIIIAKTIKGKGVSFMENNLKFHGSAPNEEETEIALKELDNE
ncbi:MAG: transketolase [Acidobacteriota bacterium]